MGRTWQNTAVFGNLILKGKTADSVTGVNPYRLLSFIQSTSKYDKTEYINYNIVEDAIAKAKLVIADKTATQADIDAQYVLIQNAISSLIYTAEAMKVKRFTAMPSEYKALLSTSGAGAVVTLSYQAKKAGSEEVDTKNYNVYLPYGYDPADKDTKYNVFYLMHGGGENENTLFGGPGQNLELKRILDNMIAKHDIEPMIVVTPSFYNGENDVATFYKELVDKIIPEVETKYNTYCTTGTLDDIKATREHRAFGGFSMGSVCTWYVFANCLDYIKYYVPLSGECWAVSGTAKDKAEYLANVVKNKKIGLNDFELLCATGSGDIAYPNMKPQMDEMKKLTDTFIFDKDISVGNCYFIVAEGGTHAWNFVNQYLYDILPDLFK